MSFLQRASRIYPSIVTGSSTPGDRADEAEQEGRALDSA